MKFDSYHWYNSRCATPQLEAARKTVATGDRNAFQLLLRSDDPVSIGIALDQYHHADAATRHGTSSPFDEYSDEVIALARAVLKAEPSPPKPEAEQAANHASALLVLMNHAAPEDAASIARALEKTHTTNLQIAAAYAASSALEGSPAPDERLIIQLEKLAFDETAGLEARRTALSALGQARTPSATNALCRALTLSDAGLQATAALHLLERENGVYRDRIAQAAQAWPDDAPYPAYEVLDALAGSNR